MNARETLYEGDKPYVFISYNRKDRERILPLLDIMREHGYRFWYDRGIDPGDAWSESIAEHLSHCAVFMPFLSPAFLKSPNCLDEVRYAHGKKKIVPVCLDKLDRNTISDELKFLFSNAQEVPAYQFADADAFAACLDTEHIRPCREADADAASAELVTNERPVEASPSFVGRVDIMRDIEAAFRDGATVVNLYGMGGIGKSEICRKLFHDRADAMSRYVGWLTWRDTLQNTLYAQFPEKYIRREDNAERYLNLAREFVRQKGRGLLIFLDNADDMTDAQAAELTRLGCRFLVTSRRKQERFFGVPAGTLTPEECRILYRRALRRDETLSDASPDAALDEIIRLAARHTLTVELLAKTQRAAGMDAQELLDRLTKSGFDLTGVDEEIVYEHRPELGGDGDGNRTFLEHMTVIFDLSGLRADALRALQGMSLLAPNEYIPVRTVKKWLDLPNLNGLNRAADTGWLNEQTESDGTRAVSIHPVVSAVVRRMSPPDADYVDAVAGKLYDDMIPEDTEVYVTKLPLLKHAMTLNRVAQSMDLQTENYADMLYQIGYLIEQQGDYVSALEWLQKDLCISETVLGKDHTSTATTYSSIADIYRKQGKYASSLERYQKALRIYETAHGTDLPFTAATYNNIAVVYHEQGDYVSALEWFQKALRIDENVYGTNHPSTATTYNNIAGVYYAQGDYASALKWSQKALRINETILGTDHPSTATTYNSIAHVYWAQGDYTSSLEWLKKALRIRETVLGTGHPDTEETYYNIGAVYFAQSDFREALQWFQKAQAINRNVLGAEHPHSRITQEYIDDARERMTQEETL